MKNLTMIGMLIILIFAISGCTRQNVATESSPEKINKGLNTPNVTKQNTTLINESEANTTKNLENKTYTEEKENKNETLEVIIDKNYNNSYNNANETKLAVYYFYSPLCFASKSIKPKIDELEIKYNTSASFIRYNVLVQKDLDVYNNFTSQYNVSQRVVPLAFIEERYLTGMFEINDSLENIIVAKLNSSKE